MATPIVVQPITPSEINLENPKFSGTPIVIDTDQRVIELMKENEQLKAEVEALKAKLKEVEDLAYAGL